MRVRNSSYSTYEGQQTTGWKEGCKLIIRWVMCLHFFGTELFGRDNIYGIGTRNLQPSTRPNICRANLDIFVLLRHANSSVQTRISKKWHGFRFSLRRLPRTSKTPYSHHPRYPCCISRLYFAPTLSSKSLGVRLIWRVKQVLFNGNSPRRSATGIEHRARQLHLGGRWERWTSEATEAFITAFEAVGSNWFEILRLYGTNGTVNQRLARYEVGDMHQQSIDIELIPALNQG